MNITDELQALRDERYATFQRRLLPTLPPESIIGVRTPFLRNMAIRMANEDGVELILSTLPHRYFEENQLHAFIISEERDFSRCLARVEAFLPFVDNWATCDQLSPRTFARHHADLLPRIRRWIASPHEYTVRFGIGMLLRHFLDDDFTPEHLQWVVAVSRQEYYISTMQAWYLATALAKQWDATLPLVATLPNPLRRMTVRKACESFRVSDEHKSILKNIKAQLMKQYDFDTPVERHGTDCFKWDALPGMYGRNDLTPMWVADMDWPSPDFVLEALRQRLQHPVLGYTMPSDAYWQAVIQWLARHYDIHTTKDTLHFIPGIVAGISFALLALTQPGDRVLVTTPVYPPFLNLPRACGRQVVCSPLLIEGGRFVIDFDDLERRAEGCKVFVISNPHNPGGTLWDNETLLRVADISRRKGLLVISDEIHADLTLPPARHVSYSTVSPHAAAHSLTFIAPSKTFNIAGLGSSICHIPDASLRDRFFAWLDNLGLAGGNIFAFTAAQAAFALGDDWQRQMLQYLNGNVQTLDRFLHLHLPKVKAVLPQASYLAWLDFSPYGIPHNILADRFINEAHVVMNDGTTFGLSATNGKKDFEGCFRLNLGCPRAQLLDCLERIEKTINKQ